MRFVAVLAACVGLLTLQALDARAQEDTIWDQLPDPGSHDLLVGPKAWRATEDARNLSAPPAPGPLPAEPGRSRELSPGERQELLDRAREPRDDNVLWDNRDRN